MLTEEFEHKYTSINIVKRTLLFLYYSGEKRREEKRRKERKHGLPSITLLQLHNH